MNIVNVFSKKKEIKNFQYKSEEEKIYESIKAAEAIVIGAGAGMSTSAGFTYGGERFEKLFSEYIEKYHMEDMYSGGFYPFETQEEKWAYWSKHIYYNRYDVEAGKPYIDLFNIVKDKKYFVITTNVDHQFEIAGFPEERIFATQGDYGFFQCAKGCHKKLYSNEKQVREMVKEQKNCKIPSSLVPKCPVCRGEMEVNLRCDGYFVEDENWYTSYDKYKEFLEKNINKNIVFIELGTGMNTPSIIKYPFWRMTRSFPKAKYICINLNEAYAPPEIESRSICVDKDISVVLQEIKNMEG